MGNRFTRRKSRIDTVADDMQVCLVAVRPQFACDEFRGAVNVAKSLVEIMVEKLVKEFCRQRDFSESDVVGDVFRLDVERGEARDVHFSSHLFDGSCERKRQIKMYDIKPVQKSPDDFFIDFGKRDSLRVGKARNYRNVPFRKDEFVLAGKACGEHPDRVSFRPEIFYKASCRSRRSVVQRIVSIDNKSNNHST